MIALFGLDGFKHYNDAFGQPAGDGLLTRLGKRLETAVAGSGKAYRMVGGESSFLPLNEHAVPSTKSVAVAWEPELDRRSRISPVLISGPSCVHSPTCFIVKGP